MPSEYSLNFGSSVGGLRSHSALLSASTSPTASTIRLYSSPSCSATMLIDVSRSRGGRPRRRRTSIAVTMRSEEHTSELQSLMRISYAVFCLKKKTKNQQVIHTQNQQQL